MGVELSDLVVFVVAGLASGAVYALAGVGLVLTYRTTGIFNFAHGALATVAAYLFYTLFVTHHVAWPLAAAVSILVAGPVMGVIMEALARRLTGAPLVLSVSSTVGVLLAVAASITLMYGQLEVRSVRQFLGTRVVHAADAPVALASLYTVLIGIFATTALSIYLRRSRTGLAMRAVVDDAELLDTAGISPVRTRRMSWIIGSTLAASSGVLFAPLLPLDPIGLTFLVVAAYGAAALGGFRSLPMTFAGGLLIGVGASLATRYVTSPSLAGVSPSLPFLVLFAVLLVYPKRRVAGASSNLVRGSLNRPASATVAVPGALVLLAVLAFVPAFAGQHLTDWTTAMATVIVLLSLSLLVRTSGQVSLCHVSFMAIGAAAFSHLAVGQHMPWLLALVLAGVIAIPVGALLAIPAVRLSGLYLALATFGFGLLLQFMFYSQSYMFGTSGLGLNAPRPHLSFLSVESDTGFYYLVLALAGVCGAAMLAVQRSRLGRLLRGVSEAPTALETSGASVTITRVLVFCIAAFLAAIGGALAAASQGTVTPDSYAPITSLSLLVLVVTVLASAPWNAVIGAIVLVMIPSYFPGTDTGTRLQLVFGLSAILVAVLPESAKRLPRRYAELLQRGVRVRRGTADSQPHPAVRSVVAERLPGALTLSDVTVRFGGVIAVEQLNLEACTGQITGLIGPNGAGKTTTFNACSGLVRPSSGDVTLLGRRISRVGPARRARAGLGRTFQKMQLFDSLTVRENIALGAEGAYAGRNPLTHLFGSPAQRRSISLATNDAIDLCGLGGLTDKQVSSLSTGHRRLVDLARCLAGDASILLLDEPSSGLDRVETEKFAHILRTVARERGIGILLVEHDLTLVLDVCDAIYVLDFGRLLFSGTPAAAVASPIVRAAYLGDSNMLQVGSKVESSLGVQDRGPHRVPETR